MIWPTFVVDPFDIVDAVKEQTREVDVVDPETRYASTLFAHETYRVQVGYVGKALAIFGIPLERIGVWVDEPLAAIATHRERFLVDVAVEKLVLVWARR